MIATCLSQFDCDFHKHIGRVQMRYASSPSSTTTASSSSSSLFELHQSIMIGFGDSRNGHQTKCIQFWCHSKMQLVFLFSSSSATYCSTASLRIKHAEDEQTS
ncbi:uncharacterized protein LOC135611273 [Musa acuminata AAA Group]|uniref:uncharacterized protein LOC135611273 n=1 Tax=Musa acuminata AAA Group TaxID=214697 RepID=UPI0031D13787